MASNGKLDRFNLLVSSFCIYHSRGTRKEVFDYHFYLHYRHQAVRNLPDGHYATGDLFEPHQTKPNTWRYIGRGDDVLVLVSSSLLPSEVPGSHPYLKCQRSTSEFLDFLSRCLSKSNGEKVNPNKAEALAVSESQNEFLSTMMFGSHHTHCGLLVLLAKDVKISTTSKARWKIVLDTVNLNLPTFAQIWPEMVIFLESQSESWPTSSKGLSQRKQILDLYSERIEALYSSKVCDESLDSRPQLDYQKLNLCELMQAMRKIVKDCLSDSPQDKLGGVMEDERQDDDEKDLFELGLNSLKAIRIKTYIQKVSVIIFSVTFFFFDDD